MGRFVRILASLLVIAPLLTGCGKVMLYAGLAEGEANEMLVVLDRHGIACEKIAQKEGLISLAVPAATAARAIALLQAEGLPREKFVRMSDIFKKDGLISSPTEERVRFLYGLQQEIAGTLSHIDGVLAARVNIVLPEAPRGVAAQKPSAAAVFLKVQPDVTLEPMLPQIKLLVANSVEGLSYDKVTVALFPAQPIPAGVAAPGLETVLGVRLEAGSETRFWLVVGGLGGLSALALAGNGIFLALALRRRRAPAEAVDAGRG